MTAAWWARPWVSTPPMTTRVHFLVRLGMLGSPFRSRHEPGQARTGRAGGHTSDKAWSHKLVSGHTGPSGRVHDHAALPDRPTDPGMTPRSGRFRVRPTRQNHPHDQGPAHLHWRYTASLEVDTEGRELGRRANRGERAGQSVHSAVALPLRC